MYSNTRRSQRRGHSLPVARISDSRAPCSSRSHRPIVALTVALLWLAAPPAAAQDRFPAAEWESASPESLGLDAASLARAEALADGAGMVVRFGRVARAWGDVETPRFIYSSTKSIGALLLGLAIDDGLVALDDEVTEHHGSFGEDPEQNLTTGWLDDITLRQLATHTAGFDVAPGFPRLRFEPGSAWLYSDGGTNWLAETLTLRFGADLWSVLAARILRPLSITDDDLWWRSHRYRDETIGGIPNRELGSGIAANVDALARLGYLVLRRGRWSGRQLVSEEFISRLDRTPAANADLVPHDDDVPPSSPQRYGLLWWHNRDGSIAELPRDALWSWGLGESLIVVVPSLDLVVARVGEPLQSDWSPDYAVIAPFLETVARAVVSGPPFRRGDATADGRLDVSDAIRILDALFGGADLPCADAADATGDLWIDVSDAIRILLVLFTGSGELPTPGAPPSPCGTGGLDSPALGCASYTAC